MFCAIDAWARKVQEDILISIDTIKKNKNISRLQKIKRIANENWPCWAT